MAGNPTSGMNIRILNLPEVLAKLKEQPERFLKGAREGLERGSLRVMGDARKNAPVKTGRLYGSIGNKVEVDESAMKAEAIVGAGVDYAIFQELGTKHMRAHPFLLPALESNKDKVINDVEGALKRAAG